MGAPRNWRSLQEKHTEAINEYARALTPDHNAIQQVLVLLKRNLSRR